MPNKSHLGPSAILLRMRRAIVEASPDQLYLEMVAAMPFDEVWECVSFMAEHKISSRRRGYLIRQIDRALKARRR